LTKLLKIQAGWSFCEAQLQYAATAYTARLLEYGAQISMAEVVNDLNAASSPIDISLV
jgi:hypothetical protein